MKMLTGLGRLDRERLSSVIRESKGSIISVADATNTLNVSPSSAAKMLARWASKGWLSRVRRGLYIPVPLESRMADVPLEDPWLIAERLYAPSYIGGWSAAEYWDITEQIFRTIIVMTTRNPKDRAPLISGTTFMLRTVSEKNMFGLKSVWRGEVKISISDPSRTILDMLNDPRLGGGIRSMVDMFTGYLKSKNRDIDLLLNYADQMGNGAIFKRLGFLLERLASDEKNAIAICRSRLTQGNAKLDPSLTADRLVTRWRLWIPVTWVKESGID